MVRYYKNDLPDVVKGDSFPIIEIVSDTSLDGWGIELSFSADGFKTIKETITPGNGMTKVNATTYKADSFIVDWDAARYDYRLKFISPNGYITTSEGAYMQVVALTSQVRNARHGTAFNIGVAAENKVVIQIGVTGGGADLTARMENVENLVKQGVKDIYTAEAAIYPTTNGLVVSGSNPALSVTRIAKRAEGQTGDLVFSNLKKADGTAHANITAQEWDAISYNVVTDTWVNTGDSRKKGDPGAPGENSYRFPVSTNLPPANAGKVGDVWLYIETIEGVVACYEITKQQEGWDLGNMVAITGPQGRTPTTHYTSGEPINTLGFDGDTAKWTDNNGNRWETVKIAGVWDVAHKYLSGEGFSSAGFVDVTWAANLNIDVSTANKHKVTVSDDTTIILTGASEGKTGIIEIINNGNYHITLTGQVKTAALKTTLDFLTWINNGSYKFDVANYGPANGSVYASTIAAQPRLVADTSARVLYKDSIMDIPINGVRYILGESGTYSNLKLADGSAAPAITAPAPAATNQKRIITYNNGWQLSGKIDLILGMNIEPEISYPYQGTINNVGGIDNSEGFGYVRCTDFMAVTGGKTLTCTALQALNSPPFGVGTWCGDFGYFGWYDESKNFISRERHSYQNPVILAEPANARYMRFATHQDQGTPVKVTMIES